MLTTVPMIERFVNSGTRKRIVDLFMEGAYRSQAWDVARGMINKHLRGNPFMAEASDLLPMSNAPAHIKSEVLSWFLGQEIYAAHGELAARESAPPEGLALIPMDLQATADKIYQKLPLNVKVLPADTIQHMLNVKYIIDGANVLFSSGVQTLRNIINHLKVQGLGKVVVVIHRRHSLAHTIKDTDVIIVNTPYGVNDDYYAIWLAMTHSAYLVTNDQFRDHVYYISPLIRSWRKQAIIGFTNENLVWPLPFSHCIQFVNDAYWFPTEDPGKWIKIMVNI